MSTSEHGHEAGSEGPGSHTLSPEEVLRFKVKAELRKRMRGVRKTTPIEACVARSNAIIERIVAHPALATAKGFV